MFKANFFGHSKHLIVSFHQIEYNFWHVFFLIPSYSFEEVKVENYKFFYQIIIVFFQKVVHLSKKAVTHQTILIKSNLNTTFEA